MVGRLDGLPLTGVCRGACIHLLTLMILAAIGLAGCRTHERHTLTINGPVHVFRNDVPPSTYPGTDFIAILGPNDHVEVLELHSGSGYRAVKIRLSDGREGWVFSGESIEVH